MGKRLRNTARLRRKKLKHREKVAIQNKEVTAKNNN